MKEEEVLKQRTSLLRQPKAVWAVAFACVISFMGIGLVDPILPAIASQLDASPSQVSLLFTSYLLVTGFVMFFTGFISSRIGAKWTLLIGLIFIIVFSALGGTSSTINELIGFRGDGALGMPYSFQRLSLSLSACLLEEVRRPLFYTRLH